ncbi:MAG: Gfo/Idh/MocA family oxidoreductase [Acidobacteria bacterium]|nr:Gfo/Idh/MocA family oxidoreductase [Acidobacteriota bacterium]
MKKIRAGIIGAGFVGPLHMEAARRLGYVDFVGIATSNLASAQQKAERYGISMAFENYAQLLEDPTIDAVHICTPNHLHYPVVMAAIDAGKHVICDKPLALSAAEAREMRDAAKRKGVVNAVTFNYRFNALVQQAHALVAKGELGKVQFVHGCYLQDWLLFETDFSWRLEADKGGVTSSVGDIGSHWCDTAQFISGLQITRVLSSLSTMVQVRKKPKGSREAFASGEGKEEHEEFLVTSDDLGSVLVEFDNGAKGAFSVGQVCPGHKNDLQVEVNGSRSSLKWVQERPDELWLGYRDRANATLLRDASLMDEAVRGYVNLPGGHGEGWADAFKNLMSSIYSFIAAGYSPSSDADKITFPTFEDGYRANCVVDAIVRSNQNRSMWTTVEY